MYWVFASVLLGDLFNWLKRLTNRNCRIAINNPVLTRFVRVFPRELLAACCPALGAGCMFTRAFNRMLKVTWENVDIVFFRSLAERSSHVTLCLHGELSALLWGHWESCSTYCALCWDARPPCWILESFTDPGESRGTVHQKNPGHGHGRGMSACILQTQIVVARWWPYK